MPTTSAFAAERLLVRGLDCAFTVGREAGRCPRVQSLHLPERIDGSDVDACRAWLGVGMGAGRPKRPPNLRGCYAGVSRGATLIQVPSSAFELWTPAGRPEGDARDLILIPDTPPGEAVRLSRP